MSALELKTYRVGMIATNCYFLIQRETRELVVVDPGGEPERLKARIDEQQLKPRVILLTHGHADHIMGANGLKEAFHIPMYVHEADRGLLENPELNMSAMFGGEYITQADMYLEDSQELSLAGFRIQVLWTPGHTPGGCCFYLPDEKVLLSGDTLFCDSVGRTDFPGGSMSALVRAIKDKLMTLPDDTEVYPGHGETTVIGHERRYNAWIR